MNEKTQPAQPPREPGSDADQRRREVETNPALSPVGPQGGDAIAPLRRKPGAVED